MLASLHRAPGVAGNLAAGLASRSQYLWVAAAIRALQRPRTIGGPTRFPGVESTGTVRRLRRGYDQWDYRGFAELTGEHTGNVRQTGSFFRIAARQRCGSGLPFWRS